ncbi:MAG: hypothetical protein IV086_11315 [Hyphomonadaceae bacterium]|nr:MAG: hypothetical protein FD160_867 [Caulobacteraceae bacterium]MBT9446279.1 hypothetical protein [Hyphomonadaceae bacterium]TPW08885.1 MAG: hypothetical protein FD124_75 [Alphaproteobacteria bacterium]
MIRKLTTSLFAAVVLAVAACSAPAQDEALTRGLFDTMRAGDLGTIYAHLPLQMQTVETQQKLTAMRGLIPQATPTSIKTESWSKKTTNSISSIETTHRYEYADRALIVETSLVTPSGGQVVIEKFNINVVGLNGTPPPT